MVVVGRFSVDIDDDRGAALRPEEWALRQAVAASQTASGKPRDIAGPAIPADNLGGCCCTALVGRMAGKARRHGGELRTRNGCMAERCCPPSAALPPAPAGARMLASMGWGPGQGLGRQPSGSHTAPVLPVLRQGKAGLGSSANVKQLGAPRTAFRRAAVVGGAAVAQAETASTGTAGA